MHRRLPAGRGVLRDRAARAGEDGRRRRAGHRRLPDRAGRDVQLMPDPSIPTEESGTRHRTAQRVSSQTGYPVISVSQSMRIIGLYVDGRRYVMDDSAAILSRANQALATLERYKLRLDEVAGTLSALEIEDLVTVRDVDQRRPAAGDGAPDRRRDRGVRRRARHRRPAAGPAAGGAAGRRRRRAEPWSRATTCPPRPPGPQRPRRRWRSWPRCPSRSCSTSARSPAGSGSRRRRRRWRPR